MKVVAPAWPAESGGDQPSGRPWRDGRWDRRVALLDGESAALLALGSGGAAAQSGRGHPTTNGTHWRALARLTEPLDATVAGLHHGDRRPVPACR